MALHIHWRTVHKECGENLKRKHRSSCSSNERVFKDFSDTVNVILSTFIAVDFTNFIPSYIDFTYGFISYFITSYIWRSD